MWDVLSTRCGPEQSDGGLGHIGDQAIKPRPAIRPLALVRPCNKPGHTAPEVHRTSPSPARAPAAAAPGYPQIGIRFDSSYFVYLLFTFLLPKWYAVPRAAATPWFRARRRHSSAPLWSPRCPVPVDLPGQAKHERRRFILSSHEILHPSMAENSPCK